MSVSAKAGADLLDSDVPGGAALLRSPPVLHGPVQTRPTLARTDRETHAKRQRETRKETERHERRQRETRKETERHERRQRATRKETERDMKGDRESETTKPDKRQKRNSVG
eukprot:1822883-Rhodomonas_salina.1